MIQAIETHYKGYRFRSRLEARWAVFFEALGIEWEYEKEGYIVDGKPYLPDFWLPDFGFIEIKGEYPTDNEQLKLQLLADGIGCTAYIFFGNLPDPADTGIWRTDSALIVSPYWDNHYTWCACQVCGKLGIQFEGRAGRICKHTDNDKGYGYDDPRIIDAYETARSARFEHGETP